MLIPIPMRAHDESLSRTVPAANVVLIAINVFCHLFFDPAHWWVGPGTGLLSILSYAFVHGGMLHILFNMWTLWVFGNPVNRRVGNRYYVMIYLGSAAIVGLIARVFVNGPMLGSSGAVFAVMGVAFMLLPSVRVEVHYLALLPITLLIGLFRFPKYPLFWFIRWGTETISMLLLLAIFIALEFFGFLWWGFYWGLNWTNTAHLLGFFCGIGAVLMLPSRISMRSRAGTS
jgi:membrane associated rhomboid family serine protease